MAARPRRRGCKNQLPTGRKRKSSSVRRKARVTVFIWKIPPLPPLTKGGTRKASFAKGGRAQRGGIFSRRKAEGEVSNSTIHRRAKGAYAVTVAHKSSVVCFRLYQNSSIRTVRKRIGVLDGARVSGSNCVAHTCSSIASSGPSSGVGASAN